MNYINKVIKNPWKLANLILCTKVSHLLPDALYLRLKFRATMKKKLRLSSPCTFNEKIQWLKLYDRKPEYTAMVDKCEVKKYVADKIGNKYIIPTFGVWDNFDNIDFCSLPEQFVLKCTHDSGGLVICPDKSKLDISAAKKKISKCLRRNYFWVGREWAYKNVKPRIIAEKYMVDESGIELKDYKVFCFGGVPKTIQVDFDRFNNHRRNLYSTDWRYLGYTSLYPTDPSVDIKKPICLDEMLKCATILSKEMAHVRIDFYVISDRLYFGELTLYHGGGLEIFDPPEWDMKLGDFLILPKICSYDEKG